MFLETIIYKCKQPGLFFFVGGGGLLLEGFFHYKEKGAFLLKFTVCQQAMSAHSFRGKVMSEINFSKRSFESTVRRSSTFGSTLPCENLQFLSFLQKNE